MKIGEVKSVKVSALADSGQSCLMDNEIEGTKVSYIGLSEGQRLTFPARGDCIRIFLLCEGDVAFTAGCENSIASERSDWEGTFSEPVTPSEPVIFSEPGAYVAIPGKNLAIIARSNARLLELQRFLNEKEFSSVPSYSYPYAMLFSEAPQYTEDCKSPKTTSRMILPARIVPRFAMGSVETFGNDLVEKHTHPMLEQFFFGLSDNHCHILIDDIEYPFGANHLVHIPLGSEHGVKATGTDIIHYLWLDFLFDESGLKYMDEEHKMVENI